MTALGVLCARGASKRLPRKHLRPLLGLPLVAWQCRAAAASRLDRVILTTEDPEIAEVARANGIETPFLRAADLAQDYAADFDIVVDALDRCEAEDGRRYDAVVMLQPTTPFAQAADIDACLARLSADPGLACCFAARPATEPAQWMFVEDGRGRAAPFLGGVASDAAAHKQLLPPAWFPSGAIYAVRTGPFRAQKRIYAAPLAFHKMEAARAVDIDEEIDLLWAETVGRARGFAPTPLERTTP